MLAQLSSRPHRAATSWIVLAALALASCGTPAHTLEPAYAGPDREGYRVIVRVPNEEAATVRSAAADEVRSYGICKSGFDVVSTSRRQQVRTMLGEIVLNVVVACTKAA